MKHFLFALGLFGISAVVSVLIIYGAARYQMREEAPVPNTVIETESVNEMEGRAAANQESIITARSQYFLVSEAGFLLVFCSDKSTVCLYTHIPVSYTHLDVYKRQVQDKRGIHMGTGVPG